MGKATAKELISDGHTIYCSARSVNKMSDLEAMDGKIIRMDATDKTSITDGIDRIISEQGKVDVLWINAGLGLFGPTEEIKLH